MRVLKRVDVRRFWVVLVAVAAATCLLPAVVAAQDEATLRSFFEGRRVVVKIDMPGTSDGVDLQVDSRQPMDFGRYRERLKADGVAIHAGESVVVTLVKLKKDLIEVQLGGGGFGTFGDDTSTTVYMPLVGKSKREEELEHRLKDTDDRRERRQIERELDELRERRERENRRITIERERAEARKVEVVAEHRRTGGSRFNLRYDVVPHGIRPEEVMAALSEYVAFDRGSVRAMPEPPPLPPPGASSAIRKGMTRDELEDLLGRPTAVSERREGSVTMTTLAFDRGDERTTVELVEGVVVRYAISSR